MVTSSIFFLLYPSGKKSARIRTGDRKIPVNYALLLLFLTVWLCYQIWVVGSSGIGDFLSNLRISSVDPENLTTLGSLIMRSYPLVFTLFLFENVYANRENRNLRLLLWCYMLLYAIGNMSKLFILYPTLSWIIIQGIKGRLNAGKIALFAVVVFSLMISVHFLRFRSSFNVQMILDMLALYIYSPLIALGYSDINSELPTGAHMLRFFYAIGNILHITSEPVKTAFSFVQVPEPTNVFTVLHTFYHDFGQLGVILGAILYGIFFSCLYCLSVKRGGLWMVLFAGYSIVLVMQFFAELLFLGLSFYLQILFYSLVIFLFSRKVSYAS